jgi:hypothetical protein
MSLFRFPDLEPVHRKFSLPGNVSVTAIESDLAGCNDGTLRRVSVNNQTGFVNVDDQTFEWMLLSRLSSSRCRPLQLTDGSRARGRQHLSDLTEDSSPEMTSKVHFRSLSEGLDSSAVCSHSHNRSHPLAHARVWCLSWREYKLIRMVWAEYD